MKQAAGRRFAGLEASLDVAACVIIEAELLPISDRRARKAGGRNHIASLTANPANEESKKSHSWLGISRNTATESAPT